MARETAVPDGQDEPDDAPLTLRWRLDGGRIDAVSANARGLLGWPGGDRADVVFPDILHADDRVPFLAEIADALRRGRDRACHADHRAVVGNGRVAWWRTVTLLRPLADGGTRCVSHAFDVTGLRPGPEEDMAADQTEAADGGPSRTRREARESGRRLAALLGALPGMACRGRSDAARPTPRIDDGGAAEDNLRTLLLAVAQSPVAVAVTDAFGKTLYLNPRFHALTGLAVEAVPDLDAFLLGVAPPDERRPPRDLWRTLWAGGTWRAEWPALHASGRHFWAAVSVAPVLDEDGRITNLIGTIDDITARRQAEEQLRRAQKMQAVGVLAGGIAHDFNNILTAILGYSHLALESLPEGSDAHDDLRQVTAAAERAKDLVRQLLAFSRQEKLGREPADLRDPVREAIRLVRPAVPPGVQLDLRGAEAALPVLAAPAQLQQVVVNLCKNALDAIQDRSAAVNPVRGRGQGEGGPEGAAVAGTVAVTLAPLAVVAPRDLARARLDSGQYVCLSVADDGCGMDAATLERAFEPFFTTKPVDRGTGLGLPAVHGIVAEHGGVIDVVSAPGLGSVFTVYLPLHDPGKPHRARRFDGRRVLLLDADHAGLRMSGRLLRSQGFHVVASVDSRRGLALFTIAPDRFDVVVLAQGVTERTWRLLTLARAFAAAAPGTPILVCADAAIEEEGAAIEAAGVTRVLPTPVVPDRFVALVERLAAERGRAAAR